MSSFIFTANSSLYNHKESFLKNGYIDWKISNTMDIETGDTAYIYRKFSASDSRFEKGIAFKTVVTEVLEKPSGYIEDYFGFSENKIMDDSEFWKDKANFKSRCEAKRFARLKLISEYPQHIVNCAVLTDEFGLKPTPHLLHPTNIDLFCSEKRGISLPDFIELTESVPFSDYKK